MFENEELAAVERRGVREEGTATLAGLNTILVSLPALVTLLCSVLGNDWLQSSNIVW